MVKCLPLIKGLGILWISMLPMLTQACLTPLSEAQEVATSHGADYVLEPNGQLWHRIAAAPDQLLWSSTGHVVLTPPLSMPWPGAVGEQWLLLVLQRTSGEVVLIGLRLADEPIATWQVRSQRLLLRGQRLLLEADVVNRDWQGWQLTLLPQMGLAAAPELHQGRLLLQTYDQCTPAQGRRLWWLNPLHGSALSHDWLHEALEAIDPDFESMWSYTDLAAVRNDQPPDPQQPRPVGLRWPDAVDVLPLPPVPQTPSAYLDEYGWLRLPSPGFSIGRHSWRWIESDD